MESWLIFIGCVFLLWIFGIILGFFTTYFSFREVLRGKTVAEIFKEVWTIYYIPVLGYFIGIIAILVIVVGNSISWVARKVKNCQPSLIILGWLKKFGSIRVNW